MKSLRIVVLMHADLVPPEDVSGYSDDEINEWKTEYDVVSALQELGHEVRIVGVSDELRPIRKAVEEMKADIIFNLLEEFREKVMYDQNVVGYLEAIGIPYTGCNPRGLVLGRGKALSKKILSYHRIPIPRFALFPKHRRVHRPARLEYPLIVKSASADASRGISKASIVGDDEKLMERVEFVHENVGTDAIAEQFIEGRDVYVGVLGNRRLQVLAPQELVFKRDSSNAPTIATEKVKHDVDYQKKWGVDVRTVSDLDEKKVRRLEQVTKRIFRALNLDGYARIDYRLNGDNQPYFLEANPNPDLARYEELANAAEASGISYESLLQRILNLGLRRD